MRSLLAIISVVLYLILTLPVLLIISLIGKKNPEKAQRITQKMIRFIFKLFVLEAGTKVTVIGKEKIPSDSAVLYAANHRSIFDVLIAYQHTPDITSFVSKEELGNIPVFKYWAKHMTVLLFNRNDMKAAMKMIMEGTNRLKNGRSVFIFPDGTRKKEGPDTPLLPFHEGSFRMAKKSGCPIQPLAINNTIKIFEAHKPWLKKTHVVFEYLDPIYPDDIPAEYQKKVGEYVHDLIEKVVERNQALI